MLIAQVNTSNIKMIVPELFGENLVRGRGLYCRSIMKAQAASLPYTPIYAALTAIINTKIPSLGELLLTRLIIQFRKAYRRNDKAVCLSSTTFIAHLCNQQVAHEILALQILSLLLQNPTDDSVEVAVGFMRHIGAFLAEQSPKANTGVFERFRAVLHEGAIDKRTQYMIEVLFQVRKEGYKENPIIPPELDLVEEDEAITHYLSLDDELDGQEALGAFKFDEEYEQNEERYNQIKAEILGEGSDDESGTQADTDESDDEDAEQSAPPSYPTKLITVDTKKQLEIEDETNTNLINLRRAIYLTIQSSVDFEEAVHKLMQIDIQQGQEMELVNMIIECCSQTRTFEKFFALMGERFCNLNRNWQEFFEDAFDTYYTTIHRYETNRLRNIAKFFAFLLGVDAIGWHVFRCIHLTEEETTSSSRIFVKILFQDLQEQMGLKTLVERLKDPYYQESFEGIFPRTNPKDIRFSINYFTSIGMGGVTEDMRAALQNIPKPEPVAAIKEEESDKESVSSGSSSRSSYSSRSGSYSGSYTGSESRGRSRSRRSYSDSEDDHGARSRTRSVSRSRSPSPRRRRYDSKESVTPSPPRRGAPRKGAPRHDSPRRESPVRRPSQGRPRSPSPRMARDDSPSRRRDYSPRGRDSPRRRRQYSSDDESPVPRRRYESPPARRPAQSPSPPPRRDTKNAGRAYRPSTRDDSPAPRRNRGDSPPYHRPPPRHNSPRRNRSAPSRRDESPSPRRDHVRPRRRDDSPRRRETPPRRRRDSPPRKRYDSDSGDSRSGKTSVDSGD